VIAPSFFLFKNVAALFRVLPPRKGWNQVFPPLRLSVPPYSVFVEREVVCTFPVPFFFAALWQGQPSPRPPPFFTGMYGLSHYSPILLGTPDGDSGKWPFVCFGKFMHFCSPLRGCFRRTTWYIGGPFFEKEYNRSINLSSFFLIPVRVLTFSILGSPYAFSPKTCGSIFAFFLY